MILERVINHFGKFTELRKQLQRFENTVASVPKAVLNEVLRKFLDQAKVERADSNAQFSKKLEVWESEKVKAVSSLISPV